MKIQQYCFTIRPILLYFGVSGVVWWLKISSNSINWRQDRLMDQTAVHENGKKLLFLIISDGCAVRVLDGGDRDRSLEDADKVVVPGLFSFGADTVHGACW